LESLTNEQEYLIFQIKPKLLSIGTITISNEIILLSSVGVFKIKIIEKFELVQRTSYQRVVEVVFTTKSEDLYVRPKISLEDKVYLETYYHHT
jgi:hypothetical protein